MQIDKNCIKDVLHHVANTSGINAEDTCFDFMPTNLMQVIKSLQDKYSKDVIIHSTFYASKCGYIDMKALREIKNVLYIHCEIFDVTPSGYKFLEEE